VGARSGKTRGRMRGATEWPGCATLLKDLATEAVDRASRLLEHVQRGVLHSSHVLDHYIVSKARHSVV
jgi:hypothetical protein